MKINRLLRYVILLTLQLNILSASAPVAGLAGYWPLDNNSGIVALDKSGNNYDGTLINGPAWSTEKQNEALNLNGTSQYVSVPSGTGLNFGKSGFSFGGWFQTSAASFGHLLSYQSLRGGARWSLVILATGQVEARISDGFHQAISNDPSPKNDGAWHYAMAVTDRAANRLHLYLDGTEIGAGADIAPLASMPAGAARLAFGANNGNGLPMSFFRGSLAEIRVYNRALSPPEVMAAMNDPGLGPSRRIGPRISVFSASPASITAGHSATLSWTVANATSITISNGPGAQSSLISGSVKVSPNQTTVYQLIARNGSGTAAAHTTVTVQSPVNGLLPVLITVDPKTTYTTYNYNIVLVAPIYQGIANSPDWPVMKDPFLKQLVNQLGINTLDVVEFPGDIENTQDLFTPNNITADNSVAWRTYRATPVNDDADPNHFNCSDPSLVNCPTSFPLAQNDWVMDNYWVGPQGMRALIAARGQTPHLLVSMNAIVAANSFIVKSPSEFAEEIAAVFLHDQNKYGTVPDIVQTLNEPDGVGPWTFANAAAALVATRSKLASLGFHPQIWCCTGSSASNALIWYNAVKALTGPGQIDGLSFHFYGGTQADLQNIAAAAAADGIPSIMTEQDFANIGSLLGLMRGASPSGFMRFTDGSEASWGGIGACAYVGVTSSIPYVSHYVLGDEGGCTPSEPAYFFPQFSNYVGEGYLREQATVSNGGNAYDTVAFRNPAGKHTVIVRVIGSAAFLRSTNISNTVTVAGVPAGTYGCTYTFDNASLLVPCGPDQTIAAGGTLTVTLPYPAAARGSTSAVITFFGVR